MIYDEGTTLIYILAAKSVFVHGFFKTLFRVRTRHQ